MAARPPTICERQPDRNDPQMTRGWREMFPSHDDKFRRMSPSLPVHPSVAQSSVSDPTRPSASHTASVTTGPKAELGESRKGSCQLTSFFTLLAGVADEDASACPCAASPFPICCASFASPTCPVVGSEAEAAEEEVGSGLDLPAATVAVPDGGEEDVDAIIAE